MPPASPVALVTGGARRIGRAIVEDLAAHGWAVAIHCNHSRDEADGLAAAIEREWRARRGRHRRFRRSRHTGPRRRQTPRRRSGPSPCWSTTRRSSNVRRRRIARPRAVGPANGDQPDRAGVPGRGLRRAGARGRRGQCRQPARPEHLAADAHQLFLSDQQGGARHRHPVAGPGAGAAHPRQRHRARPGAAQRPPDRRRLSPPGRRRRRSACAPDLTEFGRTIRYIVETRSITGQVIALDGGQHLA